VSEQPTLVQVEPTTPKRRSRWWRWIGLAAAVVIIFALGAVAGAAGNSHHAQLTADQARISRLESQANRLQSQLVVAGDQRSTAVANMQAAQATARTATATANAKAKAAWASKMAAADALLRTLRHEQQVVSSSTISADGVYVVGQDIPAGIYHTSGSGGGGILNQCYYATLNSTNTSDISDNNNFNGPETVNVNGVYAFQISGGCTWTKIG
jgi:hypothetical protein